MFFPNSLVYKPTCLALLLTLGLAAAPGRVDAQNFGAQVDGFWSNAGTWTPGGGPPGAGQNAFIGSNSPAGSAATATVTLSADQLVGNVTIGNGAGTNGTLDLAGFHLTVTNTLTIGATSGTGTVNHGGGRITTNILDVRSANSFSFSALDTTGTATASFGGTLNTVAVGNVSTAAGAFGVGSQLNLGANLTLTGDLDARGLAANVATVNANGFDITARDIFVGRFGNAGAIVNRGNITATRDFEVSNNTFSLNASDSVTRTLHATYNGVLNLHANTAALNLETELGGTINTAATGNASVDARIFGVSSQLNMGANLSLSQDLDIRGVGANVATVDANGFDITARDIFVGRFGNAGEIINRGNITATRNFEVSNNTFSLNANDSVTQTLRATNNGVLNLHANTAALNLETELGGTINTAATGNASVDARIFGAGSQLNLGANLSLSQDLDIRGLAANVATVNANGFDITARDIFVGRFGNAGEIINRGNITATRNFEVSNNTFSLNANDSVTQTLRATNNGVLNLHANTASQNLQTGTGGTINTTATGNVSTTAEVFGDSSQLNLGANLSLTQDLDIRGLGANVATVNANGFNITARDIFVGRFGNVGAIVNRGTITATRDLEVSNNTFSLNANDSVTRTLFATSNGVLNLHANTASQNLQASSGGTINTAAVGNVSTSATSLGAGSLVNLGANLSLTGDLDIRGLTVNVATVNANGFNINADRIFVGRFDNSGSLINDGAITANRLLFDRSNLTLTGGNDVIQIELSIVDQSTLIVQQASGELTGLTFNGNTFTIDATSSMILNFDGDFAFGLDWAFRWANPGMGDRVAALTTFLNDGRLVINDPTLQASIFDGGDGYTYVGYTAIPEPSTLLLVSLVGTGAWCWRRRQNRFVRQPSA